MQIFFRENYNMQFRDFGQKEKDGLKYIIVKHQFLANSHRFNAMLRKNAKQSV